MESRYGKFYPAPRELKAKINFNKSPLWADVRGYIVFSYKGERKVTISLSRTRQTGDLKGKEIHISPKYIEDILGWIKYVPTTDEDMLKDGFLEEAIECPSNEGFLKELGAE